MDEQELVIEKVWQLFPEEQQEEAFAILEDYGSERWQLWKEFVQLMALKMCNGKLDRLRNFMKTGRGDYRDLYLFARGSQQFRVCETLDGGGSMEELTAAEQRDREQYEAWLQGSGVKVCEECNGLGLIHHESPPITTSRWEDCRICAGTGNQK